MGKKASLAKLATAMREYKTKNKRSMSVDDAIAALGENDPLVRLVGRKDKRKTDINGKPLDHRQVLNQSLNGLINANTPPRIGAEPNVAKVAKLVKSALGYAPGRQGEKFEFDAAGIDENAF